MAGQEDPLARRGNPLARLGEPADGDSEATQADLPEPEAARDAATAERTPAATELAPLHATRLHASGSAGEVLAVYSPKGGVGTSLLTSQLASAAAVYSQLHTVLVDLNPTGGDAPAMVGVSVTRSVLELLTAPADALRPSPAQLAEVTPAGLEVLAPTPPDPAADGLAGAMVESLLGQLRAAYDLVVIDVPARVDDWTVTLLAAADRTLLVSVPNGPARRSSSCWTPTGPSLLLDHIGLLHNMDDGKSARAPSPKSLSFPWPAPFPMPPVPPGPPSTATTISPSTSPTTPSGGPYATWPGRSGPPT